VRTFLRDSVPRHLLERVLTAACRPNNVYTAESPQSYRDRRSRISEMPYQTLSIARSDKAAHMRQMARKLEFFGAPARLSNDVDRLMSAARCRSPGMHLQTVMLLLQRRRPRISMQAGCRGIATVSPRSCGHRRKLMLLRHVHRTSGPSPFDGRIADRAGTAGRPKHPFLTSTIRADEPGFARD
jgi:hypothetical protein